MSAPRTPILQPADSGTASRESLPGGSPLTLAPSRLATLFQALETESGDGVHPRALMDALEQSGLRLDDPRLADSRAALTAHVEGDKGNLSLADFERIVGASVLAIERALRRELVIPDFPEFQQDLARIFRRTASVEGGAVADYIPQLGRVNPDQYGVSICTIDGQRARFGDADVPFCVQSCTKVVNYCLALETSHASNVHQYIGCEPSGQSFNELTLNPEGRPHNPMINAGAIMSCALIEPHLPLADRFDHVLDMWQRLSGGSRPGFSNSTYLSERKTADRNFAIGYSMREKNAFPEGTDLVETLEFYFQCCSLEVTTESMSVVAATLANGGVCPLTGERVLSSGNVQRCLSLMYSCGMYDFSGEWAFTIGLPAKSGVAGGVMVVVPNVMGFCTWSPRLDPHGNSVRGIEFCRELVETFNFHNYDNLVGGVQGKKDPRQRPGQDTRNRLVDLCWAASEGDLAGIRRLVSLGVDLDAADYDGRTALHLAASEGQRDVVAWFLRRGAAHAPVDRWGNTPLDDARRAGHDPVARLLEQCDAS